MIRAAIHRAARSTILPRTSRRLTTSAIAHDRRSRSNASAAAAAVARPPPPLASEPVQHASPYRQDDMTLKDLFDQPSQSSSSASAPTGLFDYPLLTSPGSLRPLTERALVHGQAIVDRICNSHGNPEEMRKVVKNIDRLSDILCGIIDMCELTRSVHPDQVWVEECDLAYERLCSFMNGLNTHTGLYEALNATLHHPHAVPLTHNEKVVALSFLRDFERSGISLPPATRARFVEISDSLLSLGRTFLHNSAVPARHREPIEIPEADRLLAGLGSQFVDRLPRGRGHSKSSVFVMPGSWDAQMIGRYAREGEARRLVHVGNLREDPEKIEVLETLLQERAELADVLGKETYGHVALADKMAKTPANVNGFLSALATHHRPAAAADVAALQRIKATGLTGISHPTTGPTSHLPRIHAWDREFYSDRLGASLSHTSLPPISQYFSVGTVFTGLSRLFTRLYGISFRPAAVAPGEVWDPAVRRIDVVDEAEGQIGVIYCDLFGRAGKASSAAHYTVRCSRRVDDDDVAGDPLPPGWDAHLGPGLETDGTAIRGKEGRYQLPIVVLATDCGEQVPGRPNLLHWNDLETLFHEMGHAIHSMIGRTEFHNVSGTRCATDFVELPSILMEHFVSAPEVLSMFAAHHETGAPMPLDLINAHLAQQTTLAALETHGQIVMATLDQRYHALTAADVRENAINSTKIHHDLQTEIGVIPPVEHTAWQTQFGHLFGYGATYYAYLFDRAIAGKIWSTLSFGTDISRAGGEVLKNKVLKWGGGKDPWEMVGSVVGGKEGEIVSKGDEKSMDAVGHWLTKR